jgi:hypothetical protein
LTVFVGVCLSAVFIVFLRHVGVESDFVFELEA